MIETLFAIVSTVCFSSYSDLPEKIEKHYLNKTDVVMTPHCIQSVRFSTSSAHGEGERVYIAIPKDQEYCAHGLHCWNKENRCNHCGKER